MEYTISQIAQLIGGKIEGDENAIINRLSKIEEGGSGSLSFLANPKYEPYIYNTSATAVIIKNDFTPEKKITSTLIRVENPYTAFAKLLDFFNKQKKQKFKVSRKAKIARSAKISKNVYIGEFVSIAENVIVDTETQIYPNVTILENVKIGKNVILYPGVSIMRDSVIGNNCIIHSGTVIGSDGFGFAPNENGEYTKIPQTGNVIIEDDVEIGANTCIDRATIGSTIIRKGAKLDNLIQVAHNVEIGSYTVVAGQTGIAGSTKIGKYCMFGGQVGIGGHLTVADKTKVGAQTGISATVKNDDTALMGSPAMEAKKFRTSFIHFRNLDKLVKKIDDLEKEIKQLKG